MDWLKLAGFTALLFMLLEAVGTQIMKLKTWIKRVIIFVLGASACVGLGIAAPFVIGVKAEWLVNALGYFIAEYLVFLFLRNELNINIKGFLLRIFGGQDAK